MPSSFHLVPQAYAQTAQTNTWTANYCEVSGVATVQGLQCLIGNVMMVAVSLIGFAGFVMLIFGAFRYLISGGNSKGTEGARNTIMYAVIGLILALSSFVILNLIAQFTGIPSLTTFFIPEDSVTP